MSKLIIGTCLALLILGALIVATRRASAQGTANCIASPAQGPVGTVFEIQCSGFDAYADVYAYTADPNGQAMAYPFVRCFTRHYPTGVPQPTAAPRPTATAVLNGKDAPPTPTPAPPYPPCRSGGGNADETGAVSLSFDSQPSPSYSMASGSWKMVVEQTGLASSVLKRGIAEFRITGGTESVSGASLNAEPALLHKATSGYTEQRDLPKGPIYGQSWTYTYSTLVQTNVRGSGFSANEVVSMWIAPPHSACSPYTVHTAEFSRFSGLGYSTHSSLVANSLAGQSLGAFFLTDVVSDAQGAWSTSVAFDLTACEGEWQIVARGNTSGQGGETHVTLVGNPISADTSLVANPNVAGAFDTTITFHGSGFAPSERLDCWLTSPLGQAIGFPEPGGFAYKVDTPKLHGATGVEPIITSSGGQALFSMQTGSERYIYKYHTKAGSDYETQVSTAHASEGALGEWAMTCRGGTSSIIGIARFTLTGNILDP